MIITTAVSRVLTSLDGTFLKCRVVFLPNFLYMLGPLPVAVAVAWSVLRLFLASFRTDNWLIVGRFITLIAPIGIGVCSIAVRVSVCLFVCLTICLFARIFQKPHVQISPNFLYMLPVAVA